MRTGDTIRYWSYEGIDDGDVHTGTLLALVGGRATVKEGQAVYSINAKWIF